MRSKRLMIAGLLAGIVFALGFVMVIMIPGLGGTSTTKEFTDFYNSNSKRGTATLLGYILVVGCWLVLWLFAEVRTRLARSVRSDLAFHLSVVGAAAVMIGAIVELGPTMVQNGQDNKRFVGIAIAHTLTQAGAGAVIVGLLTFMAAVFLYGLEFRHSSGFPSWLGPVTVVIAILMLSSFFAIGGFLLPIWMILVGLVGRDITVPTSSG